MTVDGYPGIVYPAVGRAMSDWLNMKAALTTIAERWPAIKEFGIDVECYVLDDAQKTAMISQSGMARAIGLATLSIANRFAPLPINGVKVTFSPRILLDRTKKNKNKAAAKHCSVGKNARRRLPYSNWPTTVRRLASATSR